MSLTRSYLLFIASAAFYGSMLMACADESRDPTAELVAKVRPDTLPCPVPEKVQAKQIYYNKLGLLPIMFNALTTNPDALPLLIGKPLSGQTYDRGRYPGTANEYLSRQLEDVWARQLMRYVVSCALDNNQSVSWTDPETEEAIVWKGEGGLCPQWHGRGIGDNPACQEAVSACVLARNNALGAQVRISMRGVQNGQALPLSPVLIGGVPDGVTSAEQCLDGIAPGFERDCGWTVDYVGMCEQDMPVQLVAGDKECSGETMVRVCAGPGACDSDGAVVATDNGPCNREIEFSCPQKGSFTVMHAPLDRRAPEPGAPAAGSAKNAVYPVSEPILYSWREGAFYGNMLSATSLNPSIRVTVTPSGLVYTFAGDEFPAGRHSASMPTSCGKGERAEQTRYAWHEWLMKKIELQADVVIHQDMYACWDPIWTEGAAYAAERICAGPTGAQVCAASAVGQCWYGTRSQSNLCASDDSSEVKRDRDYDRCADDTGRVWRYPITVFLDDPCALAPGACGTRQVSAVAAGGNHSCALLDNGRVRCWGSNSTGQLGYANTNNIGDDEAASAAGDVEVGGTVTRLALGAAHTCALLDTGAVRCWGWNWFGQLGYGNQDAIGDGEVPAAVGLVDIGGKATALAAGAHHTCALLDTGDVRCWGLNLYGQLGYSHTNNIGDTETPATVGPVAIGGKAIALAAGVYHTCALLDSGEVRCWGYNFNGQLGYGHTNNIGDNELPRDAGPVDIGGSVSALTAGSYHTCALLDSGEVRCWGLNSAGQLGYGNTIAIGDTESPRAAGVVDTGDDVIQIAAGGVHTCALLSSGQVRCWGGNGNGQLGYGHTSNIGDTERPAEVGHVEAGGTLAQLDLGANHSCVLNGSGKVRCWGQNASGQLGHGHTIPIGDNEVPAATGNVPVF
jgi:hypothetical protein